MLDLSFDIDNSNHDGNMDSIQVDNPMDNIEEMGKMEPEKFSVESTMVINVNRRLPSDKLKNWVGDASAISLSVPEGIEVISKEVWHRPSSSQASTKTLENNRD
uniref:Uncharacterized protein n=1 Tax=Sphaerodactylus townsendi TaxID=933632 RepID=A0ACB8G9Q2_9SAUR